MRKIITIVYCLVLSAYCVAADWSPMNRYACGFEPDELQREASSYQQDARNGIWTLNSPINLNYTWYNTWGVGTAESAAGKYSLYISSDAGRSASYKAQSCIMIAWREITLQAGDYSIALDWKCMGGGATQSNLRVLWIPAADTSKMVCGMNNEVAARKWIVDNQLSFEEGELLHSSSSWTHSVADLHSDGQPHRLCMAWVNDGNAQVVCPSACVDNIMIAPNVCGKPKNLQTVVDGNYVHLSWESEADNFSIKYRRDGEREETIVPNIKAQKYTLTLPDGAYYLSLQTNCNKELSVWTPFPNALVYNSRCFNYLDLTDDNCSYLHDTPGDWHHANDSMQPGKIDMGYLSEESYHTIHYHQSEIDSRTVGSIDAAGNAVAPLVTVPKDAVASVRIGNWQETAHVARVTYDFPIDADEAGALILKYAMVMQSSGHDEPARPRFTLDIVDAETGEPFDVCASADFVPPMGTNDWKKGDGWYVATEDVSVLGEKSVCWRDWTTVGLNLREYNGRNARVVLTVYGCSAEIHYGYAYFTLSCTSGEIEGISCGDEPTEKFEAPEGFEYRWYKRSEPGKVLSRERIFPVQAWDTTTYSVDLIYLSNKSCYFTLTANATPRYPIAEATYKVTQRNCQNYVQLLNTSFVRQKRFLPGGEQFYYEDNNKSIRPDAVVWDSEGAALTSYEWSPELAFPNEGGTYTMHLTAKVGLCETTIDIPITVPTVREDSIVQEVQRCLDNPYEHNGMTLTKDTILIDRAYNRYGCDSVHVLNLRFVDRIEAQLYDTIREGETYRFNGREFTEDTETMALGVSSMGCDSVCYLHLKVVPWLKMALDTVVNPCLGDKVVEVRLHTLSGKASSGEIELGEWRSERFSVQYDSMAIAVPLQADIEPGWYPLAIMMESPTYGNDTLRGEVMVQYPAALIQQRWDDVLGVLNAENNGGYSFESYQWYADGVAIEGATEPYLYIEKGLQMGVLYSVELKDVHAERKVMTCGYEPIFVSRVTEETPVNRKSIRNGQFLIEHDGNYYDVLGNKIQ